LDTFVVERARTARRFISLTKPPYAISDLNILELDKESEQISQELLSVLKSGKSFGLISESGMPAVADPGSNIVALAHDHGYNIKPLVGPSSIFLALSASGLNGQNFSFRGYLPIKENELAQSLKALDKQVLHKKETQIFIETPYRNNRMFQSILKHLSPQVKLCVAIDITGPNEKILTKTIKEWKMIKFQFEKIPTIFLVG